MCPIVVRDDRYFAMTSRKCPILNKYASQHQCSCHGVKCASLHHAWRQMYVMMLQMTCHDVMVDMMMINMRYDRNQYIMTLIMKSQPQKCTSQYQCSWGQVWVRTSCLTSWRQMYVIMSRMTRHDVKCTSWRHGWPHDDKYTLWQQPVRYDINHEVTSKMCITTSGMTSPCQVGVMTSWSMPWRQLCVMTSSMTTATGLTSWPHNSCSTLA